jgi:NADH:ubiquinone oxidoreductase subunit K
MFLAYVAMFSLSFWSIFTLLPKYKAANFTTSPPSKSLRAVSIYLFIIAIFFYFQELGQYFPALINNAVPSTYAGTGFLTNPSHVLDLAFILPLVTLSAVLMWQQKPHGNFVGGIMLALLTIECASIASDQYFGSIADPYSNVVSMAVVPIFAILSIIGLLFLVLYFRASSKKNPNYF